MSHQRESERVVYDDAIALTGRIYGHCPVQAEGTIAGKRFYFRARWDAWSFAVAESDAVDPVDIELPGQGFLREALYGKPTHDEASWMDYDDAEAIIRRCAQEFVDSHASRSVQELS